MDKGIRQYCNNKFVELNELRRRGLLGNTAFRKSVMCDVMEQFGCTLAAAATHYNHAFKTVKELNAELVSGLGRPEDKKGGRKPKVRTVPGTNYFAPSDVLLLSYTPTEFVDAESVVQEQYTVKAKKTGDVLAEGLSYEDARDMVRSGRFGGKFCKMYFV